MHPRAAYENSEARPESSDVRRTKLFAYFPNADRRFCKLLRQAPCSLLLFLLVSIAFALVGLVMGSDSDWPVMQAAAEVLDELGVAYEADVVSAHRMPLEMIEYGRTAAERRNT